MSRIQQIGFDRRIRLEWLEQTANLCLAGYKKNDIRLTLQDLLKDQLSHGGKTKRGCREKTITILMKIWATPPDKYVSFRNNGLELLKNLPQNEHLVIHWGMATVIYPFFGTIAEIIGRLLRLQNVVTASQLLRRIKEQYGDRSSVERAAKRVLRSMIDWGVLSDTDKKGVYQKCVGIPIADSILIAWIIEASLMAHNSSAGALRDIIHSSALFPFMISPPNAVDLERNGRLELFRHGLDEEMCKLIAG